jgi:octaprenyl-diphosphate synthase
MRTLVEENMPLAADLDRPADAAASLQPLLDLVGGDLAEVNAIILSKARSDVELIPELAQHLINSGGKRLRPMITLAAAHMFGYRGTGHVLLASSVEFMHTATLLHDDVVDESDLRRGKATARLLWGNQASVLVGDFLLGQAFKMMVEAGSMGALRILSNAAAVIAEGEVMQLAVSKDVTTSEDEYMAVINAKTAALFSAAAEVGGIIADRSAQELSALRTFGTSIGLAFQLVDDALDYSGEAAKLGKTIGDDFREGKITLPVVLAYRRANPEERLFFRRTLEEGDINEGDLTHALAIMRRYDAIDETMQRARYHAQTAKQALMSLPRGTARAALLDAVSFSINRVH